MAKKISLQLEINGVKQSVSSIDDLEKSISDLKNQLKGVEIGSDQFNKLTGEIRKAQNFAEDLNETLKPQGLEQRVQAYAKVGSAIVSSFAAAQATMSLFGEESEDIAKAAAKAQAVLTIALTAREAAEGLVAIKTVAANIATMASAAAATAATTATRTLYATLASNPYTAILAVVGLVAGALISMGDAEEEVVDVTKELNATLSDSAVQLKQQLRVLQNANTTENTRLGLIKELNKEYPGFNAFVDEENRLTKEGITFLNLRIKQYESEARIKFILNKILAAEQKQIELTNEDVEKQIGLWDELVGALKAVGTLSPGESARVTAIREQTQAIIEQQNQLNELNVLYENEQKNLQSIQTELAVLQKKLEQQVETENKSKQAKEELKRRVEELNKAYKEGRTSIIELSGKYRELDDAAKKYQDTLEKLSKQAPATTTLQDLENFKKFRKELLNTVAPLETFREKVVQSFSLPSQSFETLFKPLRQNFEKIKVDTIDTNERLRQYNELYQNFLSSNTELSQVQKEAVANLLQGYVEFEKFVQKTPGLKGFIDAQKNIATEFKKGLGIGLGELKPGLQETLYIFGELGLAFNKLTVDFNKAGDLVEVAFDPKLAQENANNYLKSVKDALFIPIGTELLKATKRSLEFKQSITDKTKPEFAKLGEEIKRVQTEIENFQKTGVLDPKSFTNIQAINDEVDKQVELYKTLILGIVGYEEQILKSSKSIDQAFATITSSVQETSRAQGILIAQNIQAILPQIYGPITKAERQAEKAREKARKDVIGLEKFKLNLQNQGLAEQIKNNEDLLDAYIAFKQKEVDATKEAEDEKQNAIKETFTKINQGIQIFSQTLNEIASLSNQSIQNQLTFLEKSTKASLDQVVGDTESAEKKREEIRADYAQKKQELEKKQAISSLKFSLVQAIANAAQAITSIFAQLGGTPLAFIQSAIVAGLTTAEIAIINEQINTAQMFRRGGLTKAQGGMLLSGPTHEQGGIPLAQMGVIAEGQEAIINRNSLINYRDLLSTVNQAGGGRPLVVNSFDDTRIVEAIAEQRQKPLRAYVLQSEITNEQALSKRLDDLSKI